MRCLSILLSIPLIVQTPQAYAGISTKCVSSDVCFSLNIPSSTASSGNGDIYVQISGPTTYSWLSVAQGSRMGGSNYFVVYTDASSSNVTLSPRHTSGHNEPTYNSAARMTLLSGSKVSNGVMTANIKCSNCQSWSGGSMDLTSSSGTWIWAYKYGNPLDTDSTSASIAQHDNYGTLQFDSSALGGSDANPFLNANDTSNLAGNTCTSAAPSSSPSTTFSGDRDGDGDEKNRRDSNLAARTPLQGGYLAVSAGVKRSSNEFTAESLVRRAVSSPNCSNAFSGVQVSGWTIGLLVTIHGILAGGVFCFVFPIGGVMIRLLNFRGLLWAHGILQVAGYIAYVIATGIGAKLALHYNYLTRSHSIIGFILVAILLLQAPIGWFHHLAFKRTNGRTAWSYLHLLIGRIAIPLGIVNAVLGIKLAQNSTLKCIAVGVVGGIVWIVYLICTLVGERRRSRRMHRAAKSSAVEDVQEDYVRISLGYLPRK